MLRKKHQGEDSKPDVGTKLTFRAACQYDPRKAAPVVRRGPHTFLWQYLVFSLFGRVN